MAANAELVTVNKEMETFRFSVSHDVRSPLRAIDGFSLALLEDCPEKLSSAERRYLDRIRAATARMGELIDSLLTLARTARSELSPQEVNLSTLASEIVGQLRASQPDKPATAMIAPDLPAVGDRELLRSVLANLLGNAWKLLLNSRSPASSSACTVRAKTRSIVSRTMAQDSMCVCECALRPVSTLS
jgi:light-regulated signal transduction histidine kinase (bacteriophytochrome)